MGPYIADVQACLLRLLACSYCEVKEASRHDVDSIKSRTAAYSSATPFSLIAGAKAVSEPLYERALKASSLWSKRVYKREGTVPTRSEWLEWLEKWMDKHRDVKE